MWLQGQCGVQEMGQVALDKRKEEGERTGGEKGSSAVDAECGEEECFARVRLVGEGGKEQSVQIRLPPVHIRRAARSGGRS